MKPFLAALSAALLILLAPPSAARKTDTPATIAATPALWVVKDADTTIYLFGTIHMLDPRYHWFEGKVRHAFEGADELVVETVEPPKAEAQAIVARLAGAPDRSPLSNRLPKKVAERYRQELAAAGLPVDALDHYQPWFAAVTLSMLQYNKVGMSAGSGVDVTLMSAAKAAQKPIHPLETFAEQLGFFSSMSENEQIRFLSLSIEELRHSPDMIGTLTRAWAKGDVKTLAKVMNKDMREMPALSKRLLDDRNARWADWIKARLARPGTVFVAVGAGHLGGTASVQTMLARRGIASARVQ
ncbi:MAG TPA: TraB/GumN family protein [Sphingomonadaceae bacterium]|nr:TraB/GumN family protein [Sphingomonadaceae bacterium]